MLSPIGIDQRLLLQNDRLVCHSDYQVVSVELVDFSYCPGQTTANQVQTLERRWLERVVRSLGNGIVHWLLRHGGFLSSLDEKNEG